MPPLDELLSDLESTPFPPVEELEEWAKAELMRRGEIEPQPLFRLTTDPHPSGELVSIDDDGIPVYHCHKKQFKALNIHCRFLLVLAGWQSGKSSVGPPWLLHEMRRQGPGNYLAAAPSFKLLDKYPVPGISRLLGRILGLGEVVGGAYGEFRVSEAGHRKLWPESRWPDFDPLEPSRIIFGHADNPDSLASFTGKGAWLDEPGMKRFKQESFEEVRGRLSTTAGRMLLTTRPYLFHWLKTDVYDRADRNRKTRQKNESLIENGEFPLPLNPADDGYEVVEFESIDNPMFKRSEWDSAKLTMPSWRFDMKYRGRFTKPAGAIYDCFDPDFHILPGKDFVLPATWPLYCGIDFGSPNFAATFFYENCEEFEGPTKGGKPILKKSGKYVAFAEYRPNESKKVLDHVEAMRKIIGRSHPDICVGGSKSEGQWRSEFAAAGWPIWEPDQPDVEVGISRVYATFAEDRLFLMDTVPYLINDVQSYSREVDENGDPIDMTIEDKDTFHSCDSARYLISYVERKCTGFLIAVH